MYKKSIKCAVVATSIMALICPQATVKADTKEIEMDEALIYSEENYENEFVPGHVIVSLESTGEWSAADELFPGVKVKEMKQLDGTSGAELLATSTQEEVWLLTIEGNEREDVLDAISVLKELDNVNYAEPDYYLYADETIPNDTYYTQQYGLTNIDAPAAWDQTTGNASVVIGVIDSGIEYTHTDLAANIWTNPGEIAGDGIDNDGNGYIDDIHGWDFVEDDNDPTDENGHGTHCAGIIAAAGNNSVGVSGVNWNASLVALRFLDEDGSGSTSDAISAINYATAMDIPITNNSWGGGSYSQSLYNAINKSNLCVFAAGNNGRNITNRSYYPASFSCSNMIVVAAVDSSDSLAYFSNYSTTKVDLAAPGVDIYSTYIGGTYEYLSGTSMATPFVTGAAGLLLSYQADLSTSEIVDAILGSVDTVSSLSSKVATGGRLNVANMLASVATESATDYSAVYDYTYYSANNPDVLEAYGNDEASTFQHFLNYGMAEGRVASANFNVNVYKNNYEDLQAEFGDDYPSYYMHFIQYGQAEGRNAVDDLTTIYEGVDYSPVFDYDYYINANEDVVAVYGTSRSAVLSHFVNYGMAEGRQACEEFNVYAYQQKYEDLQAAFGDDLKAYYMHYINYGMSEGRTAN